MIFANVNVTIKETESVCDYPILLYRGDKNVQIRFILHGNKFVVQQNTYAQLIINRPTAPSLFTDPYLIEGNTVTMTITEDMIDELTEIGTYQFQIRLFDDNLNAQVTLPPCYSGLIIEHPIAVEGESLINRARINDAIIFASNEDDDIFDDDNLYIRTNWMDGDLISDSKMNKIEKAIYELSGRETGGGGATAPYISTTLPENNILGFGEIFKLHLDFSSPAMGRGKLKVFINDKESMNTTIQPGENSIDILDTLFSKGNNRLTIYVIDRTGVMSNSLTFYVRYGSLEIVSDFDAYTAYDYGAIVRYYFTPTSVDTSLSLTMYMSIDGEVKPGVTCTSDTRGYYTFPNDLGVGAHYCQAYIKDSAGSTSNTLTFNLIILDDVSLVVASDTVNPILEEGSQLSLDYKVYMKNNTSFITKTYVDDTLVSTGTCGLETAYYKTSSLSEGIHTIKIEVYDITETVSDYIIWTVTITPSTYTMLEPATAGALFIATTKNMTNASDGKEVWVGKDQDGTSINATLNNFAFNSESGWVDDELLITGASSVEVPIAPLANNARYGFTLDLEFASKMIGVEDALVLNLWDDVKDCGIKITTEKVILRSAEGNQCDLYFTDDEMTSVIFVIDRNEATAKIYLNGVMCSAFHLSDYSVDGVPYLEDFTVNSNIILGGSGHARIRNLRVYQIALTTNEILNNFMANESDKSKQRELVEFQKGEHLPTLTIYCDFSGLGKDDKKPCSITYVSTDEEKYGKSFTLTHKKSTCQYQGTSSMAYPIKNYRINLADENGNKLKYEFPFGQPEHRYTLKADFMSSGHWTNTGLTKWINNNLYNYDEDDEKSMNPKKWYDINNGGKLSDTRECIYGFPCRLILVNDGNTPLNEGQNEPTPGNTKDMGIFNFNHDKDATDTMGFDDDVFPNCASYEVTANSDTSAGAFISYINSKNIFKHENAFDSSATVNVNLPCEIQTYNGEKVYRVSGSMPGNSAFKILNCFKENTVYTLQFDPIIPDSIGFAQVNIRYTDGGIQSLQYKDVVKPVITSNTDRTIEQIYFTNPNSSYICADSIRLIEGGIPEEGGADELEYIKQSFELRFPDEDDVAEDWGFMGIEAKDPYETTRFDTSYGLKALIDWVDNCTDEEFVRDFEQHFHKDYTLRYFLLVITLGMVDNLGKNMMLDTWDNKIFMPRFYDCDTICSYDNSGQLKFDVDIEMSQGYWNTSSSRLWTRIRDLMHDDLVAKYNDMRQNGLSYESLMQCFYDEQIAKIPQKYYNMDYDVKYAPFSDSYLGMANGDTYEHLKRWLKNRLIFVDTLYDYAPSYNNDMLTIRANTTEPMTIYIETYTPVYQHLSWYNGQMDKKKIDGKVAVEFTGTAMAATDQEVLIYGGTNIKKITGISSMNPNRMLIGSATRLIELDAHDCPLLSDINANKSNLAPHAYLNKVNLSDCPLLAGNLIINNSPLVREIDIRGTGIVGLNLPSNLRNLEVLKLPSAIKTLNLNDAGQLHTLEFEPGSKMETVSMTNCNALTNVVNFDLENVANVTLNNSYNIANELYFSKTTNLSLRNMSNLERVIYLPNAEYETFDKTNVDNAKDYKVSTFNCPTLTTFMTTAPYRDSYNNCGLTDISYTGPGYQTVLEAYNPNGEKFKYTLSNCVFDEDDGIEIEIDVSSCIGGKIENIISIGKTSIDTYKTGGTYHFYYNAQSRILGMYNGSTTINTNITLEDNENIVHIKFNKSGLFINDVCYASYSYNDLENAILVGSEEGATRSNATINHLRYYTKLSNITIQAKDYGEVKPDEVFIANSIDISNTQFTDVKLLATTDTNMLKLPSTTKNIIVDSAYDLDTEYLTDGDYDTIHTDLYEPYNTDYEDVVGALTVEMILKNLDKSIDFTDNGTEYFEVIPGTKVYFTNNNIVNASNNQIILYEYDKDKVEIKNTRKWSHLTDEANAWVLGETTRYIQIVMITTGTFTLNYFGRNYNLNLIPSASDGSLIFAMHAPSMTDEPDSGVWDMKGLDIDTYRIFGLNNDIVQDSQGKITMPNRYDDYEYRANNLRIKNQVLRYTASAANVFPTFIAETDFQYDSIVVPSGSLYDYIIVAKDPNNLPSSIDFSNATVRDYFITVDYIDTSNFDTMENMFNQCSKLISVNLTGCNTSKVTDMAYMFNNCTSLERIIGLDQLDTKNVTSMTCMFNTCNKLTSLDLSNFDTSKVEYMHYMFNECRALTSLDVSNFDTSSVKFMYYMFNECRALTSLDVSNFDTSSVTNMESMFENCRQLTSLDVSNFDTSKVEYMHYMFYECNALTSLDVSNFDTSSVTNMDAMFYDCSTLTSLDLSNFDTSSVTNMGRMFCYCIALTSLDLSSFNTSNVTSMYSMFYDCRALTSLDLSNFDTSSVTTMEYTFGECHTLTSLDLSNFDTSSVTTMSYMFENCRQLTSLDVSSFDTTNVTNMTHMFINCNALSSLDLSNFDTTNVTDMRSMFQNCNALTSLDLSNWDTKNVKSMNSMFKNCNNLEQLRGNFVLNNVNCVYMFQDCFKAPDLSEFKMSGTVTDVNYMFDSFGLNNTPSATSLYLSDISLANGCVITGYTFFKCTVLDIYPFTNINANCDLGDTALSQEVLLRFINNLVEVTTSPTLRLGTTNLAKLTEEQIAIAVNKGWTVV